MSSRTRTKRGPSIWVLTWAQRLQRSWTRWSLTRVRRRLKTEELRLRLILEAADNQQLLLKELEHRQWLLTERQREMGEIREFRMRDSLPALSPPTEPSELDELLGLTTQ